MKKKKIIGISAVVIITIALAIVGILLFLKQRNVVETGNILGVSWYNEADTEFTITTAKELRELAKLSDFYDFEDQTIYLGADIVLNEGNAEEWTEKAPKNKWVPISGFAGTFDGQGHTISGLYAKTHSAKMAIFTDTTFNCKIEDFSLVNSYLETGGDLGTASIVSNGGGKFSKIYSDAIIVHKGGSVAGIASVMNKQASFSECWFDGSISATLRNVGGIVDTVDGVRATLKHCLFSGTIKNTFDFSGTKTGGIIGRTMNGATVIVEDCLVSGTVESEQKILTGSYFGTNHTSSTISTSNTYASEDVYSLVIGQSGATGTLEGSAIAMPEKILIGTKAYQYTTLNFNTYWVTVEEDTPILKCFADTVSNLDGIEKKYDIDWYESEETKFIIRTKEQLYGLSILSAQTNFEGCTISLGADIIVNEGKADKWAKEEPEDLWLPIASFAGIFDGQGHSISGLYLKSDSDYLGLFKKTTAVSKILNLKILNSYFEHSAKTNAYMGSVAGESYGLIENIYSDAILVSMGNQIGGIVGRTNDNTSSTAVKVDNEDYAVIRNCWFDGSATMAEWKDDTTVTKNGDKMAATEVGGIVGRVTQGDAIIEHCLNTGTITSAMNAKGVLAGGLVACATNAGELRITDCLNVGDVIAEGTICVGSILGRYNHDDRVVRVTDVYATKESHSKGISTNANKGTLLGSAVQVSESMISGYKGYQFTTLDFDNYWAVDLNPDSTPILAQFADSKPSIKNLVRLIDISWYSTDATELVIDSLEDLYGFAILSASIDFKGQTIKLGADIAVNPADENTVATWFAGTAVAENPWIPIGSTSKRFAGTFDGQGHTISGVYLTTDKTYQGLFGATATESVLKNFKLVNSYFAYTGDSVTEEGKDVTAAIGSIAGETRGTIDSVYSNAVVTSTAGVVGGITARANDTDKKSVTINNCWFDGQVILTGNTARHAAGIVGVSIQGTLNITNCLNSGSVSNERDNSGEFLAGMLGLDWGVSIINISGCLNTGTITAKNNVNCIGSIIGRIQKKDSVVTIKDTYATKESCVKADGITPVSIWSVQSGATVNGSVVTLGESWYLGYKGYQFTTLDFDNYWTVVVSPDSSPILASFASTTPSLANVDRLLDVSWYSADAKELVLDSLADLYGFALLSANTNFAGQTVKLGADIDVNDMGKTAAEKQATLAKWVAGTETPENPWITIGSTSKRFTGTFDGQGHTISGVYLTTDETYRGLFGSTATGSVIKDFSLVNSYFAYTGDSLTEAGKEVAAALGSVAGEVRGTVDSVYSNAVVTSTAGVVGGITGRINDADKKTVTINNCWFDGQVILTGNDARYAGGIAAAVIQGTADIAHCFNTGSVSNERNNSGQFLAGILGTDWNACTVNIADCLNTGTITAKTVNCIGSIVGRIQKKNSVFTVTNTYASSESCTNTSGTAKTIWSVESGATLNGSAVAILRNYLLGYYGYTKTTLDFEGYWVARDKDVPALKNFAGKGLDLSVVLAESDTAWYENPDEDGNYHITNVNELYGFAELVNDGTDTFAGKTIYLDADIEINTLGETEDEKKATLAKWIAGTAVPANLWTPIGLRGSAVFNGTFDGQGHTISGLYLSYTDDGSADAYLGLFGAAESLSEIKNLRLVDSYMKYDNDSDRKGYLGSIAGRGRGLIDTVYSNVYITSDHKQVGGIIGCANYRDTPVVINNCWYGGKIVLTGEDATFAGGIVGSVINGKDETIAICITNCLNTGMISSERTGTAQYLGGLIGAEWGAASVTIDSCLNVGTITTENYDCVGSIMGAVRNANTTVTFSNTYATVKNSTLNGTTDVFVPSVKSGATADTSAIEAKDHENGELEGFAGSNLLGAAWVPVDNADVRKDIPVLESFKDLVSASDLVTVGNSFAMDTRWYYRGIRDGVYYIETPNQLYTLGQLVNGGNTFAGENIYLTVDIEMNDLPWTPIGTSTYPFSGNFDGQGYTISGIYVNATVDRAGLFGSTKSNIIKNIIIKDSSIYSSKGYVGSVVGYSDGTKLTNLYSNATIVVSGNRVGGIVGCVYSASSSKDVSNCWFDGSAKGAEYCGGIVGHFNYGTSTISNVLVTGSVETTKNAKTASTGGILGGTANSSNVKVEVSSSVSVGTITTGYTDGTGNKGGVIGYRQAKPALTITNVYTTHSKGIGTQSSENKVEDTTIRNMDIDDIKGVIVYDEEDGINLDFNSWIARKNDVPIPRYFMGIIVSKEDCQEAE